MRSIEIPVDRIDDNPWQTREVYDEEYIQELAESIMQSGLLQVPIGRLVDEDGAPWPDNDPLILTSPSEVRKLLGVGCRVQVAFGHNRLRGHRKAKLPTMEVDLRPLSDEEMAKHAWTENKRRKDISPIEEARAIQRRIDDFKWTHETAAKSLGLARATVSNKLRMLRLPAEVLEHVRAGKISERQAVSIVPAFEFDEELTGALSRLEFWQRTTPRDLVDQALRGQSSEQLRSQVDRMRELAKNRLEEERRLEELKKRAQAEADGKSKKKGVAKIPTKRELGHSNFAEVSDEPGHYCYVAGCSPACSCRGQALDYDGKVAPVCLSPKHHQKLKAQETKTRKAKKRQEDREMLTRVREKYFQEGRFVWTPAAIRALAHRALIGFANAKDVRHALDYLWEAGHISDDERSALDGLGSGQWNGREPALDAFLKLRLDVCLFAMLLTVAEKESREIVEYDRRDADELAKLIESVAYGTDGCPADESIPAAPAAESLPAAAGGDGAPFTAAEGNETSVPAPEFAEVP